MFKVYYVGILSAFLLASAVPAESLPKFKTVFGISSTTDYLNQLIVLTQIQKTLLEINETNAKILKEEKSLDSLKRLREEELDKDLKQAEEQMDALAADVLKGSEARTKDIQSRLDAKEGRIADLQKGLVAESNMTKWAKTVNKLALGKLGPAVNFTQRMDATSQKTLENEIAARRKSVAGLEKQIAEEQSALRNIYTSPEYQKKAQALNAKIVEYRKTLSSILNAQAKIKQERIFGPYNQKADDLLKQLNTQVKDAKCNLMKTASEAKSSIINQCKQQKLDGAKKAMTDKFSSCQSLSLSSTVDQINQCITDYRTSRK